MPFSFPNQISCLSSKCNQQLSLTGLLLQISFLPFRSTVRSEPQPELNCTELQHYPSVDGIRHNSLFCFLAATFHKNFSFGSMHNSKMTIFSTFGDSINVLRTQGQSTVLSYALVRYLQHKSHKGKNIQFCLA